jgi:replicative DNA helicase
MLRPADISPLSRLLRRMHAAADGTPASDAVATGFPSLDRLLAGGVRAGDLVVLGGDTGSGKSAFALSVALRASEGERPALFVSGEASVERTLERLLAAEARARLDDIRTGALDEPTRIAVGAAGLRLRDNALRCEEWPAGGMAELAERVREAPELRLVVVDSLQLLADPARPHDEAVMAAAHALKRLALSTNIAVLVTSHLPRFLRERDDPRPVLDDFGGLGAVRQHADVVLAIYREEMYTTSTRGVEGATELLALKNRHGNTGYADLYFYKQWMRFEDMLDPDR